MRNWQKNVCLCTAHCIQYSFSLKLCECYGASILSTISLTNIVPVRSKFLNRRGSWCNFILVSLNAGEDATILIMVSAVLTVQSETKFQNVEAHGDLYLCFT